MVVATLALVAGLGLVIASKRRDAAVLVALGARRASLRRAFLLLGLVLAAGGTLAGGTLGVALAWLLDRGRWVRLPPDVYFLDHLPFRIEAGDLAAVGLTALLLGLAASSFVASRVAGDRAALREAWR